MENRNPFFQPTVIELLMKIVHDLKQGTHTYFQIKTKLESLAVEIYRAVDRGNDLLSETQIAQRYSYFTIQRLRYLRKTGKGPAYYKLGGARNGHVFYRLSDIEAWLARFRRAHQPKNANNLPRYRRTRKEIAACINPT